MKIKNESIITNLIQLYNDSIKYFNDVPPQSNPHMPLAYKYKRSVKHKQRDIVTINFNNHIFRGRNQYNPMATSTRKANQWYSIAINKRGCKCKFPYPIRFILLHEMIHVRRRVLGNYDFLNKEYQDMNKEKARILFNTLNQNKKEFYNELLKSHGYDFVILCHFLTKNILYDISILKGMNSLAYDKLISRIYYYDEQAMYDDIITELVNEIECGANNE